MRRRQNQANVQQLQTEQQQSRATAYYLEAQGSQSRKPEISQDGSWKPICGKSRFSFQVV